MSKTLSATDRPAECLGVDPVIESVEDLDKAIYELSFLGALDSSIDARCTEQIESLKSQYEKKKVLPFPPGRIVYIKERVEQLTTLVCDYCRAHRSELLEGKKKTRTLPHGSVSFKDQPAKVEYRAGLQEADSMKLLDKLLQSTLIELILAWLKSICIFGTNKEARLLSEVVELKPKLSIAKIKEAYEKKRLTTAHLKQLGLKYTKGSEKLTVKPSAYDPGG